MPHASPIRSGGIKGCRADAILGAAALLRRVWTGGLVALAAVSVVSASLSAAPVVGVAAAAERVVVRAAFHAGAARIVIDGPHLTPFKAAIADETLTVRFERPFSADLSAVASKLSGYVTAAHLGSDGRSAVFTLARPLSLTTSTFNTVVVLDLKPQSATAPSKPSETAATQTAAAAAPTPTGPAPAADGGDTGADASASAGSRRDAARRIAVHGLRSGTMSRIVFDLPHRIGYQVVQRGNEVSLTFAAPVEFDFGPLRKTMPPGLASVDQAHGPHDTTALLELRGGSKMHYMRTGDALTIELALSPEAAAPASSSRQAPLPKPRPRGQEVSASTPVSAAPAAEVAPVAPAVPPVAPPAAAGATAPAVTTPEQQRVVIGVSPLSQGVRLSFPWRQPVAAAVFVRANTLWVVFDRPATADFTALASDRSASIRQSRQEPSADAMLLRFDLADGLAPVATRDGSQWVVDIKPASNAALATPIEIKAEPEAKSGPRVFLPVTGLGSEVDFTDPEVGDVIRVVPLAGDGFGVNLRHEFAQFVVLPTSQGIAIRSKAEKLLLQPLENGLQIQAPGGLLLSEAPQGAAADRGLFHIADWRGSPDKFLTNKQDLLHRIVEAKAGGLTVARQDLASFYFANHFAADAIGVLARLQDNDPRGADTPGFRMLKGATLVELRRFDQAAHELNGADLAQDPQAALWRGLMAVEQRDFASAGKDFALGAEVLQSYPPDWRGRFVLAAATAAVETQHYAEARTMLSGLKQPALSVDEAAEAKLLQARLTEATGKPEAALPLYREVAASPSRPNAAQAELALINGELAAKQISRDQAIDRLERLRFVWRGDATELAAEQRLGELYLANGNPREGLSAWRRASEHFPKSAEAPKLLADSKAEFRSLYLKGGADRLPPVEALGLFYDFRSLTPSGGDGDTMIRNLADRLVAVDLLGRASELLDYQMQNRLQGEEKARVGARLAVVELLDNKPALALAALHNSEVAPLPDALTAERRNLQARALADQLKISEALALIAADASPTARRLRADIDWRAKRWPAAAQDLWTLLGDRDKRPAPLTDDERQLVMQLAVALSLGGDEAGLEALRSRYGAKLDATPQADGFRVITGRINRDGSDYRQLTRAIAGVKQLESFMAGYRDRVHKDKLSAIN